MRLLKFALTTRMSDRVSRPTYGENGFSHKIKKTNRVYVGRSLGLDATIRLRESNFQQQVENHNKTKHF